MADLEKTVSIIFAGVDKTGDVFSGITRNIDQFSGKVENVTQPLADVAAGVLKTEGALAALAAGGLAYAYTKSIEFEGAAIELKRVMDDSAQGFDEAKEKAIDLSNKFGISATDILNSTASFKQSGYNIEEAMALTEASLKLATASELETSEASKILISTLKGFDAPVSDVNRLMDIFNYTSSISATSVGELSTGMSILSPIASKMGYSFEEMAGLLTPIIEVFGSGSEAANALKVGLLNLGTSTGPVTTAFEELDISQKKSNGEMKSAKEIMTEVQQKFTSLTDVQKTHITQLLAGKEQAGRMAIAFDGLAKSSEIVQQNLQNNANSINNEVLIALQSGEVVVDRFKTGWVNMAIAVGDKFQAAATSSIQGATDIENTLQQLVDSGAFDALLSEVSGMSGEVGELLSGIAKALPGAMEKIDWSKFTASLEGVKNEVGELFAAMFGDVDLTTPEGVAAVLQKIINAGTALNNVVKGLLNAWEPFIKGLSQGIDKFSEGGADVQEFVGKILGFGQAVNKIAGLVGPLTSGLGSLMDIFVGLAGIQAGKTLLSFAGNAGTLMTSIKGMPAAINAVVGSAGGKAGMLGLAAAAGYTAGTILNDNVPAVGKAAQAVFEWSDKLLNWTGTQKSANQTLAENKAFLEAQEAGMRRAMTTLEDLEDAIDPTALSVCPEIDWSQVEGAADSFDFEDMIDPTALVITPKIETPDASGMDSDVFSGIDDFLDDIQKELDDNAVDLGIDVPDKEIDKARKKVKSELLNGSAGNINVGVNVDGVGVGPQNQSLSDYFNEQVKGASVDMSEMFDPSGMADLFETMQKATDPRDIQMAEQAIQQQLKLQKQAIDAQTRLTNAQAAAAENMLKAANMMMLSGTQESIIKIEAAGVEPEVEAIIWKILKKIQVRANKSGAEFLLATK